MDDSLEVFFCDLCNTSVPEHDLETGVAARFKGRVVGGCCLGELRGRGSPGRAARGAGGAGLVGVAVLLLVAIAGATVFLEWRLSNEAQQLGGRFGVLESADSRHEQLLGGLETKVGASVVRTDFEALGSRVGSLETTVREGAKVLDASVAGAREQIRLVLRDLEDLRRGQREQAANLTTLDRDLRTIGSDVAILKAMPRAEPVVRRDPDLPVMDERLPAPIDTALPAELAHEVAQLQAADPGARFEAVDKLVASRNAAVREPLLTMVKDADLFVRRLTVEGLQYFRHPQTVEALLDALMDPEQIVAQTAHASLQTLTGEKLAFDAAGGREQRTQEQRRWREWWDKHKDGF